MKFLHRLMLTGIIATVSVPVIIQRFIFNDDSSANNELISEFDNSLDPELEKWLLKYSDQEECCGQNLNYAGAFTIKGRRPSMEDRFAMVEIPILPDEVDGSVVRIFSVLDGHGGQYAPEFVKRNLMKNLTTKIKLLKLLAAAARSQINKNTIIQSINKTLPGVINESILNFIGVSLNDYKSINPESELFKKDDKLIGNKNNKNNESKRRDLIDYLNEDNDILYKELLEDEISKVDKSFLKAAKHAGDNSGTVLVLAILDESSLYVANVGDCRGVMRNSMGEVIPLSFDHKPNHEKEKKRIEEAGGFIEHYGVWRVNGILAISRALGDYNLKVKNVVISIPDVLKFELGGKNDLPDFAILASDGLWDTHSNEEAVNHVANTLKNSDSNLFAAKKLAIDAFMKGSTDNVSVLVINLKEILKSRQNIGHMFSFDFPLMIEGVKTFIEQYSLF